MLIELMDGFAITVENVVNPKKPKATGCQEYMTISKMSQVTTLLWKRVMDRMKWKIELDDVQSGSRQRNGSSDNATMETCDGSHEMEDRT